MLLNKFINTILLTSFNTEIYNYFSRNNKLSTDIMNNIMGAMGKAMNNAVPSTAISVEKIWKKEEIKKVFL